MRPLWPPPTTPRPSRVAASSLIGRGQPDLAELLLRSRSWGDLLGDGVHDDRAFVVDQDGVALDQLEAGIR